MTGFFSAPLEVVRRYGVARAAVVAWAVDLRKERRVNKRGFIVLKKLLSNLAL